MWERTRRTLRALENLAQVSKSQGPRSPTSRPRPRSEGMAPDGAALETGARHSPGVSSQVGTRPSPARALFAFCAGRRHRPIMSSGRLSDGSPYGLRGRRGLCVPFGRIRDSQQYWVVPADRLFPGYGGSRLRAWHTGATSTTFCRSGSRKRLGQVLLHQPLRSDHGSHGSCMSGLGGIPSAWRSPTTRCPGGNIPVSPSRRSAGVRGGERPR